MDQEESLLQANYLPDGISVSNGNEINIDLSHKNLKFFPVSLFSKCVNLQVSQNCKETLAAKTVANKRNRHNINCKYDVLNFPFCFQFIKLHFII